MKTAESKPAKRSKKSHRSDESSGSEMDAQVSECKVEEDVVQCRGDVEPIAEIAVKEEVVETKPDVDSLMETDACERQEEKQEEEEERKVRSWFCISLSCMLLHRTLKSEFSFRFRRRPLSLLLPKRRRGSQRQHFFLRLR